MGTGGLAIAYVHYGWQSGVTSAVAGALLDRGHDVRLVTATGALEPRDPVTRRPRPRPDILLHLALACARFGRQGLEHRWNTAYAFDRHAREAGVALRALRPPPGRRPAERRALRAGNAAAVPVRAPPRPHARARRGEPRLARGRRARRRSATGAAGSRARRASTAAPRRSRRSAPTRPARSCATTASIPARVRVVGAGANVFPEKAPRRDDGHTIVFVGFDFARKGGLVLLEALRLLRGRVPRARLVVAGAPAPERVPERVTFLGPVDVGGAPRAVRAVHGLRDADAPGAVRPRLPRRDGVRAALRRDAHRGGARRSSATARPGSSSRRAIRSRSRRRSSGSSGIRAAPGRWAPAAAPACSRGGSGATSRRGSSATLYEALRVAAAGRPDAPPRHPRAPGLRVRARSVISPAGRGRIGRGAAPRSRPSHRSSPPRSSAATLDGRYVLTAHLATGGMGAVFRAQHVHLRKDFAVKVLRPDLTGSPDLVERFRREAEIASALDHDNIVKVSDFGRSEDGHLFLVMELLTGESLFERLRREGFLSPEEAVPILWQICAGARGRPRARRRPPGPEARERVPRPHRLRARGDEAPRLRHRQDRRSGERERDAGGDRGRHARVPRARAGDGLDRRRARRRLRGGAHRLADARGAPPVQGGRRARPAHDAGDAPGAAAHRARARTSPPTPRSSRPSRRRARRSRSRATRPRRSCATTSPPRSARRS